MYRGEFMAPVNTGLLGAPVLFLILTGQQHLRDPSLFLNHCGASVDLGVSSLKSFSIDTIHAIIVPPLMRENLRVFARSS